MASGQHNITSTFSTSALEVNSTLGCLFIAVILTSALWGIGCIQFYYYCETFWKTERRWMRLYLSSLWILDTALQAAISYHYYVCFVKSIANPSLLFSAQKTRPAIAALIGFIDSMIQVIFIRRAWYLSNKNAILVGALIIAVLAQFALALVYVVQVAPINGIALLHEVAPLELVMGAVMAFTDTFIAVVLVWLLLKSRSGLKRSDSIVHRLVIYILGSGFATAVCMIVALISAAVAPHSFIYFLCDLLVPKLYFNCLLASLNARSSLRASAEVSITVHLENCPPSSEELNPSVDELNKPPDSNAIESGADIDIEAGANTAMYANRANSLLE